MKNRYPLVALCLLLLTTVSCDSNRVFEENKKIEKNQWFIADKLEFQVNIEDATLSYNVYVNVRNAGFYRYNNFFLFVNTVLPDGQVQRDTLECVLASDDGKWLGEGLGDIWDNQILFKQNVRFPETGEYVFELTQAMRDDPVDGIMDAGIRIEKATQ